MDQNPLVNEEIEGGREVIAIFEQIKPLKVAFWLKSADDEFRYLYLASDEIEGMGRRVDYEQLIHLMNAKPLLQIDPFRIKLISSENLLAHAAIELQSKFNIATRVARRQFGDVYAEDAYIYPPLRVASATT